MGGKLLVMNQTFVIDIVILIYTLMIAYCMHTHTLLILKGVGDRELIIPYHHLWGEMGGGGGGLNTKFSYYCTTESP